MAWDNTETVQKTVKPEADLFGNNLAVIPVGGTTDDAISLGINKVVIPVMADDGEEGNEGIRSTLMEAAIANGGSILVTCTMELRINTKKHPKFAKPVKSVKGLSFAVVEPVAAEVA